LQRKGIHTESFIFTFMLQCTVINLFLNNQSDAPIIQIYCVIKLKMFRASSLPIIRSFLLYIRHWYVSCKFLMAASKQSQDGYVIRKALVIIQDVVLILPKIAKLGNWQQGGVTGMTLMCGRYCTRILVTVIFESK